MFSTLTCQNCTKPSGREILCSPECEKEQKERIASAELKATAAYEKDPKFCLGCKGELTWHEAKVLYLLYCEQCLRKGKANAGNG